MRTSNDPLRQALREAVRAFDDNRLEEALRLGRELLREPPTDAQVHQIIGMTLSRMSRLDEALRHLEKATAIKPDLVSAHSWQGWTLMDLGENSPALACFERALLTDPSHPSAGFGRALCQLRAGHYREGWLGFEWRWHTGDLVRPAIARPAWDGAPLEGRSLMVHTEQGFGDVIQFARLLPRVKAMDTRLVFACPKALRALVQPSLDCVDEWLPIDQPTDVTFDVYAPLMRLPWLLGLFDERDFKATTPYLQVDASRARRWRMRIPDTGGLRIGVCWQGSPTHHGDALRSLPLRALQPLADVPGVSLFSLQKGTGEEQIEAFNASSSITVLEGLDGDGAFLDTAAVMAHLDLVISTDTAVAHLAGALGARTWLLVSTAADWRWGVDREDSPWYPTLRVFRQKRAGCWDAVIEQVVAALREMTR